MATTPHAFGREVPVICRPLVQRVVPDLAYFTILADFRPKFVLEVRSPAAGVRAAPNPRRRAARRHADMPWRIVGGIVPAIAVHAAC